MDPENQKILNQEKKLGKEAAAKATAYLIDLIKQRLTIRGVGMPDEPILEGVNIKSVLGEYRLLGLSVQAPKHAFIQNYGFTGTRNATKVFYEASRYKIANSQRASATVNLPSMNLFDDLYTKSGALEFLLDGLAETRTHDIITKIEREALKFFNGNKK